MLGVLWSLVNPLMMLAIYTFVFGGIFRMRWGAAASTDTREFALMLFAGLLLFNFFADVLNRAPGLVISNPNLVTRIVFPLEVQAWVAVLSALFQAAVSLAVLLGAILVIRHSLPLTAVLIPLVFVPLVLLALGLAWLVSALGVFLRDIGQIIGHVVMIAMFLSPLFYPMEAIPARFQLLFYLNPLTFLIGESRKILVVGAAPDWAGLGLYTLIAGAFAAIALHFFRRARPGFADVL